MEAISGFIQVMCFVFGISDRIQFQECMKTHTEQQCQQIWKEKK
jgi:hypothetical protein